MGRRKRPRKRREPTTARLRVAMIAFIAFIAFFTAPSVNAFADATPPLTAEALTQEAERIVTQLLKAYPQEADSHALMGQLRYLRGETQEAETSWERSLELEPGRADIYESLAKASWDRGEFEKTAAACRQALQIDPTMPGLRVRLGRSLLELGQIEAAVSEMEQAVSSSGRGHYYLAQAYMQSGAYEKAQTSYQRAVEINPDNGQAYYGLAMASVRLGQPEKAKQYQERFRQLGVEDPEAVKAQKRAPKQLSGLGRERSATAAAAAGAADIYRRHGNLPQAERLMQRAAMIDPTHTASRDALLALYQSSGRLEDARLFFEKLTQLQPPNARDHYQLGTICTRLNRRDEAEQAFLTVAQQAADPSIGHTALARLYLGSEWKLPAAKAAAQQAAQLRPSPQSYLLLAQVCTKLGERAEALAALERALKIDPQDAQCRRLYDALSEAG